MLVYVDLEHESVQQQPELWEKSLAGRLKYKYRLEDISGELCLIVRYARLSPELLRDLEPRAVLVSGCRTDFEHYAEDRLAGLRAVFREAAWPVLAFCGGHQLLAQSYGADIGPIGSLPPGAPDPYHSAFTPGMKQERGFMPVRVDPAHPLFAGLGQSPLFFQSHYWEVKQTPPGFHHLAETDLSPVQAIAHPERPLFGVQFHPEQYDEAHQDGRKFLENFFSLIFR
jgi:GMP synthase (glutamine-hydrolysing)